MANFSSKSKLPVELIFQDFGIIPGQELCPRCDQWQLKIDEKKGSWYCEACHWAGTLKREGSTSGSLSVIDASPSIVRWHKVGPPKGESTGWPELDELYKVRRGEWTLITGIPGHGKSEFLDALAINLASRGWRFGFFTPENMPFELHVGKLSEKFVGKSFRDIRGRDGNLQHSKMGANELALSLDWLKSRVWYLQPPEYTLESILAQAKILVVEKKIHGLVIDPWNEVDHEIPFGMNETQYTSRALSKIRRFARFYHVHVWLVAHPTKMKKEKNERGEMVYPVPTPYDVSGSSHFRNKADNAISIYRTVGAGNDDAVQIHVQKVRNKIVGRVGMEVLTYFNVPGIYQDKSQAGAEPWKAPVEALKKKLKLEGDSWTWTGFDASGPIKTEPEENSLVDWKIKKGVWIAELGKLVARVRPIETPDPSKSSTFLASVHREESDFWEEEFTFTDELIRAETKAIGKIRAEVIEEKAKALAFEWCERKLFDEDMKGTQTQEGKE